MKDRQFKRLAACAIRAARVVLGVFALAVTAAVSLRAQEATGDTNSSAGQVVTASLDYREVEYPFVNWSVAVTTRVLAFKKEPAFSAGKVTRGTLQLSGAASNEVAFAWDRSAGKLYLDLNRNLDLTDDTGGVFSCQGGSRQNNYQTFRQIHLPCNAVAGGHPMLVDLTFSDFGGLNCTAAGRAFWQGKATLQGEEWQVGLLWPPGEQRGLSESRNLLLRPWSERNKSFNLYGGSLAAVPFSQMLFLGNHAYQLQCTNEAQGDGAKVRLQFTEQKPSLGELKITGDFVQRATLEGGLYLLVLDKPEATVKVPVGRYGAAKVWLKKGATEAYLDGRAQAAAGRITISEKAPVMLTVGGPLTNSVAVGRRGRNLSLSYELVGAGGAYQMVNEDRSNPPEFTVYQGDKKLAAGKFQFG